jgi:phytoene/squalene synthetase
METTAPTAPANLVRVRNIIEEGFAALTNGYLDRAADHLDRAERLAERLDDAARLSVIDSLDALADLHAEALSKARKIRKSKGAFVIAGELS